MNNIAVDEVTRGAQAISDFGALAVMGAVYIGLSSLMMIAIFKWFKSVITSIIDDTSERMEKLINNSDTQLSMLMDIADELRPSTLLEVKNFANAYFDLDAERVCRLIKTVCEENHIDNREATVSKVRLLLHNIYESRCTSFEVFRYRGHRLSYYTNSAWVDWVAEVVLNEVYTEIKNEKRTSTNVYAVYSRVRNDFFKRLND